MTDSTGEPEFRRIDLADELKGKILERIDVKLRRPSDDRKRPFREQTSRTELFRDTGELHDVTRVIDRDENTYFEHITKHDDGALVRHVEEPLDQHQGRGAARLAPDENSNP